MASLRRDEFPARQTNEVPKMTALVCKNLRLVTKDEQDGVPDVPGSS